MSEQDGRSDTIQCPNCGYDVTVPEHGDHAVSHNEQGEIDCCATHADDVNNLVVT